MTQLDPTSRVFSCELRLHSPFGCETTRFATGGWHLACSEIQFFLLVEMHGWDMWGVSINGGIPQQLDDFFHGKFHQIWMIWGHSMFSRKRLARTMAVGYRKLG